MAITAASLTLTREMPSMHSGTPTAATGLVCEQCARVIGVYERMVEVADGLARETARAAEPDLSRNPRGSYFHASCFRQPSVLGDRRRLGTYP
jgi:hypothetical protein